SLKVRQFGRDALVEIELIANENLTAVSAPAKLKSLPAPAATGGARTSRPLAPFRRTLKQKTPQKPVRTQPVEQRESTNFEGLQQYGFPVPERN
ncbi:MAG: hypothetical protein OET90_08505, partial [Desulfuromonadales bacterium]|nr:hypothetical protein [Desulfuromonadales bacterium]